MDPQLKNNVIGEFNRQQQVEKIDYEDIATVMAGLQIEPEDRKKTLVDYLKNKVASYWKVDEQSKTEKKWKCYAVMVQPIEEDVKWDDADVSTRLQNVTVKRRPNVVVDNESSKTEDQKLRKRLERMSKRNVSRRWQRTQRRMKDKLSPRPDCPYTGLPQEDCWCLHKKEHAKVCLPCGSRYYGSCNCGNDQYDWDDDSITFDTSSSESVDNWLYNGCSEVEEQMPKDSEEYEPTVLIHIYLKEIAQNAHWIIQDWNQHRKTEVYEMCFDILQRVKMMDKLVGGRFYVNSNEASGLRQGSQKEKIFVYAGNAHIRMRQCNKLVNDQKVLHKIRPFFISESRGVLTLLGAIKTIVNESPIIVREQMEPHGDADFSMPHQRPAKKVAFTQDQARDENHVLALGNAVNIMDVVERCKIPSRLDIINFPTTATAGSVLARYRVSPNYCPRFVDAANRTYNQTALCTFANMYEEWKGSIIYTFEVVRTTFHMGQILVAFNPASVAAPTFAQCSTCLFKVMDITAQNRMDFEVEYVAETEYRKCVTNTVGPAVPADPYVNIGNVGTLNVFVYTPLTAPTIVAPQVEINVYVRAGNNFAFKATKNKTEGLLYYNVRGAVFEQMETQYDTELVPVTAQPMQGMISDVKLDTARAAKLETATTANIGLKRYPLQVGIEWDSTDTIAAPLATVSLPNNVLTAANLSINGLVNYHAFFRGKFTIIWEMNAPLQYSGLLIMMFVPNGVDYLNTTDATWQQYPYVFFNPANETIAQLDIPWSYVTPMSSTDPNGSINVMGRVVIHVWNNLQIPVGGVNTLTGALSFSMIDPQFSVKRTQFTYALAAGASAVEQMESVKGGSGTEIIETSDSALKESGDQGVFQGKPQTMQAIMTQTHTNVYDLLRRVDFLEAMESTVPTTATWTQIMSLPPFFGPMHNFIRNGYAFSNGSNNVTFVVPVGANRGITLATFPNFGEASYSDVVSTTPATISTQQFYRGTSIWRPGLAFEHTVNVPWYHRDPLISIPNTTRPEQCEYANVKLAALNNDTATTVQIQACHSIGPDFRLYFPIAFGKFRSAIPAAQEDKENIIWDRGSQQAVIRELEAVQQNLPEDVRAVLPKPPFARLPGLVVEKVMDHLAEASRLTRGTIRDIGSVWLQQNGHEELIRVLSDAMRSTVGRRRRDAPVCENCPTNMIWPDQVVIPYKRSPGSTLKIEVNGVEQDVVGYVLDYNNVLVHTHEMQNPMIDLGRTLTALAKIRECTHVREQMPAMNGFSGTTTNSQTISQNFPFLATVGVVNQFQFTATAVCTSNLATDLVDVVYTIGNVVESINQIITVTGTQVAPTVITIPFLATPTNALISVSVTTFGTGVLEHSVTIGAFTTPASTGTIPVQITGQPIRVTEYANLMVEPEQGWDVCGGTERIQVRPWWKRMLAKVVEQMPAEEFELAREDLDITEEDEIEAEVFAQSFCHKLTQAGANSVSVFCEAFTGIHSWITSKCSNAVKKSACEKIKTRLQEISTQVLDKVLPVIIWMIDFISNLYVLFTTQSPTLRTLMIASLTAKCVLAYREGTQLVNKLEELFGVQSDDIGVSMQGPFEDKLPLISGLVASAMLAGILGILGKKVVSADVTDIRKLSMWKFAESCAMLSKMGGAVKAVPTLWTAADSGVKAAISFFVEGPDCFLNWEQKNHERLIEWQRAYDNGVRENSFVNAGLFKSVAGKTNFVLLREMADFATEVRVHGSSIPHFNITWLRTANEVIKQYATADKMIKTANGRAEPVGIIVRGEAGCGKSLLFSQFLPHATLLALGQTRSYEHTQQQVYAKPTDPKTDFWDGYMGEHHKWVNIDDFGQARSEEDVGSLYNLISSSDAPVNMAELADKGILFKSDFVCCTTNLANFSCLTSIRQHKALVRRFPVSVACEVNAAYRKDDGTLDHARMIMKLKQAPVGTEDFYAAMDAVWTFSLYDFGTGTKGMRITVGALVKKIVDAHNSRQRGLNDFTALMDQLQLQDRDQTIGATPGTLVQEEMPGGAAAFYEDESDDEDYFMQHNPLLNRSEFIKRVFAAVNGEWDNMTYDKAQSLLREIKYMNIEHEFGVPREDFLCAQDDPTMDIKHAFSTRERFLVTIARLRNVKEYKQDGIVPERWRGLVKYMLISMGVVVGGVAAAFLLKKMFTMLFTALMKPLQTEQGPQYDGSKVLKTRAPAKVGVRQRIAEVSQNAPALDERQAVVSGNIRFLRVVSGYSILRMQCLALDSKYIVFPEHYHVAYEKMQKDDPSVRYELEVRRKNHPESDYIPIVVGPHNSVQLDGVGDAAGWKLDGRLVYLAGNVCVGAKSIWSHVCTVEDMSFYAQSMQQAYFLAPQSGLIGQKALISYTDFFPYKQRLYLVGKSAVKTIDGECGRPYVHVSKSAQHCLLGIHTLGLTNDKMNIGLTPLIRESLDLAKSIINGMMPTTIHVEPFVVEEMPEVRLGPLVKMIDDMWETPSMPLLGTLTVNGVELERFVPENTKYIPVEIAGKPFKHPNWRNEFLPSCKKSFKRGDKVCHPLFTGAQKYARIAERSPPLRFSMNAFQHYVKRLPVDREARALTDEEAMNGFESMGHLVMTTGAGYWGMWFQKGKAEIFTPKEQVFREDGSAMVLEYEWSEKAKTFKVPCWNKTIVEFYHESDELIQRGKQFPTFWVSTLKDELLSLEKVAIGKTRVFEQPCVVYTMLCRKYFGYFAEVFKRHAGARLHHGIGKDANMVWARYLEILSKHGGYGFDLDYKNYDGTVQPPAFEFFLLVTDHFYGMKDREARHSLIRTLQCSHHLIGKSVAESAQGNKSGNPLTDLFNSITNTWFVYVAYQWCREAHGLDAGMDTQPENFDMLTYGDDVIIGAKEEVMEYFNRVKVAEIAKLLGMTVTAANKDAELTPYDSIYDLTFLKRPFVPRHGYVAAPLPKKVIYRELMWQTKACVGNQTIFQERIKTAMEFMAHHGKEEYDKLRLELAQLGVYVEDRFLEWEMDMRDKQLGAEVEDGEGRYYVDVDDIFLDEDAEIEIDMDWEGEDWLYQPEE